MVISSQAPQGEGSEIIPEGSRGQAVPKRPEPHWGHDMIRSSNKFEAAQKAIEGNYQVRENGCWEWIGGRSHGYGTVRVHEVFGATPIYVHRLVYVLSNFQAIPESLMVCHHCDNPSCCNPEHLFLGTQKDNLHDMASKRRSCIGIKNGQCKLSVDDVESMRRLAMAGEKQFKLAEKFGVSQAQVSRIVRGSRRKYEGGELRTLHGNYRHGQYSVRRGDSDPA